MALAELLKVGQEWGTHLWSTGFTPSRKIRQCKSQISKIDLAARINWLMEREMWEEAEELLELY
jgi:hypothetical protein